MRLANVKGRLTTFADGRVVDVERESGGQFPADPQGIFDRWEEFTSWAASIGAAGGAPVEPGQLGAPVPAPGQVFAIGLNYRDHATEAGLDLPDFPATFTKFPSCIVGPDTPVQVASDTTDWEVELVVAIARTAYRVEPADGWEYIAGVTIGQDVSERTRQLAGPAPQFNLGKSFPAYGPTGPWLVTPDELRDRDDLALSCALDGETVQSSRTAQLIFSVAELVAKLSSVLPLRPGDLIFTGTPSGVGHARTPQRYISPGQQLVSEIEDIGVLATSFIAPVS